MVVKQSNFHILKSLRGFSPTYLQQVAGLSIPAAAEGAELAAAW